MLRWQVQEAPIASGDYSTPAVIDFYVLGHGGLYQSLKRQRQVMNMAAPAIHIVPLLPGPFVCISSN